MCSGSTINPIFSAGLNFPSSKCWTQPDDNKVEELSLVADFHAARFNEPIAPKAFQSELPPGADLVGELSSHGRAVMLGQDVL